MNHEDEVRNIISAVNASGYLKSRESNTVEFKQSFNAGNTAAYAKTMAAFANNRGGYIAFGVKDNPREVVGIKANNFENLNQEKFTGAVNSLFAPELVWECGSFVVSSRKAADESDDSEETEPIEKCIGWLYTEEAYRQETIRSLRAIEQNTANLYTLVDLISKSNEQQDELIAIIADILTIAKAKDKNEAESIYKKVMAKIIQTVKDGETLAKIAGYATTVYEIVKTIIENLKVYGGCTLCQIK